MKKTNQWMLITIVLITLGACSKTKEDCGFIPAKPIRYDCDRVILQLQTTEMLGDLSWRDKFTGQVYSNVISCFSSCEVEAFSRGEMNTVYIKVERTDTPPVFPGCAQCQAISEDPPATMMVLKDFKDQPCEETTAAGGK